MEGREGRHDDERESIWSIPASLKRLYFGLFTAQIIIASVWLARAAIADETLVGITGKVHFIWQGMAPLAISSAAISLTITDLWKTSMVIGTWLEGEIKQRQQKRIADAQKEGRSQGLEEGRSQGLEEGRFQGLEEGRSQGLEEERRRWLGWNRRRIAAEEAGEEFTEQPPDGVETDSQNPAGD